MIYEKICSVCHKKFKAVVKNKKACSGICRYMRDQKWRDKHQKAKMVYRQYV